MPTSTRPLSVGLILPHWSSLPDGTPHWFASELPRGVPRWSDLLDLARQAEAVGCDSLWLIDHVLIRWAVVHAQFGNDVLPGLAAAPPVGVWECWSLLAALAAATTRVSLGSIVTCTSYRNPALLAKMADTVDEISGGRLILGVGAGDFEDEHHTFGMRWDYRVSRFAEALAIIHPLLRQGKVDFDGRYYSARDCELRPRGPRVGGPPLLIGTLGHGPRMLELTARYADSWNGWFVGGRCRPDIIPPLRATVDTACQAVGRDPATLGRTATISVTFGGRTVWGAEPVSGPIEEIAETFRGFAREGIDHLQVWLNPMTTEGVEQLGAVLELLERG